VAGTQKITSLKSVKKDQWQEITVYFIAGAEYLAMRTPALASLYFDDFYMYPTGKTGEFDLDTDEPNVKTGDLPFVQLLVTGTVLLAGIMLLTSKRLRKRRNQNLY
jgi:hypothetical protein